MSLFPDFLNDYFEVSQSVKRLVGILVIVTDPFQNSTKKRCLAIQLGIRLTWSQRLVGFCTTIRTAT